jgi:RNA recognition motif-containing protein
MVTPVPPTVSKEEIESYFTALSHQSHTKMPEEVQYISAFKTAYVVYPTVDSARKVFDRVNGSIS